jgi:hypothetical protein
MATQHADDVVIRTPARQRWRQGGIGMILTGVSAVLVATQPYGVLGLVVGIVGLLFFGPVTVVLLYRAVRRSPALVLSASGFTDRSTIVCAGFVPWRDVHSIDEQAFRGRIFVTVTMKDRAAFRRQLPAWRRPLAWMNQSLVAGDVHIPESVLPVTSAELVRMMRSLRHQAHART